MINVEFKSVDQTNTVPCGLCGRLWYLMMMRFRLIDATTITVMICDTCRIELSATLKKVGDFGA